MGTSFLLVIGILTLPIGIFLVHQDVRRDPYHIVQFYSVQFQLWFRLQGPLITRQPYNFHYPEGRNLQQYDIIRSLRVTKRELEQETEKIIKTRVPKLCSDCRGKRNKPMTVQIECNYCKQGRQLKQVGTFTIPIPCNKCLGLGWIPVSPCETCNGKGSIWNKQRIRIYITPYTAVGTKLRIPDLGKVDVKTFQQGDLYIKLKKRVLDLL